MCRAQGRRCPGETQGSRGCDYVDERMRKAVDPDAPTQKFSQVHKEVSEELKDKHPKEDLERAIGPQQYENFHRVVSKMINQSDMTDHDKMIARRKWNRAEQEVNDEQVTHVTLATWEKMLAGTTLFMIDRIDSKSGKVPWRQLNRALKASAAVKDYSNFEGERIIPEGYSSYDEFLDDVENGNWDDEDSNDENANEQDFGADENEEVNEETIFDAEPYQPVIQHRESTHSPDNTPAERQTPHNPVSFARRPKSERGAHREGKPIVEQVEEPKPQPSEPAPKTASMPKVTVTTIPAGEGWLDGLDK